MSRGNEDESWIDKRSLGEGQEYRLGHGEGHEYRLVEEWWSENDFVS